MQSGNSYDFTDHMIYGDNGPQVRPVAGRDNSTAYLVLDPTCSFQARKFWSAYKVPKKPTADPKKRAKAKAARQARKKNRK